jgi:predicted ATPase
MFTKLHIHNYKAIGPEPLDIDLAPITILVGKSGSGKSCVLEALALTAQSAVEDPQHHDLVLSGTRLKLPTDGFENYREPYRQITHAGDADRDISVGFCWQSSDAKGEPQATGYAWTRRAKVGGSIDHTMELDGAPFLRFWTELLEAHRNGWSSRVHAEMGGIAIPDNMVSSPSTDRVLSRRITEVARTILQNLNAKGGHPTSLTVVQVESILERLGEALEGVRFLSSMRGAELIQSEPGPKVAFVGLHGENTVRLMASIDARTRKGYRALKEWAKKFGLPSIETGADGNQLKAVFIDPKTDATLELWQAATGSKQGLMLAVHTLLSPEGSTLLVEEPDAYMHPGYEKLLPELFAQSVEGNRQILATTHSPILVAALGNAVRKGLLSPEDVAIYHLERDDAGVHAERLTVSEKGNLAAWVKSFAEVEKDLFNEWFEELPEDGR